MQPAVGCFAFKLIYVVRAARDEGKIIMKQDYCSLMLFNKLFEQNQLDSAHVSYCVILVWEQFSEVLD